MTAKADCPSPSETRDRLSPSSDPAVPHNKTTATSLILFEEVNCLCAACGSGFGVAQSAASLLQQVDVVFDDDVGFLAAIKTFMRTTKRPVVLTSNGKHTP